MKIAKVYSHLNGLEYLLVRKRQLWSEIQAVIGAVDAEACRTKVRNGARMKGRLKYSPKDMNIGFNKLLTARAWEDSGVTHRVTEDKKRIRQTLAQDTAQQKREIENAGFTPIFSDKQTDFVKDRVAIEVQFGKHALVAQDLFAKHLAFYVRDQIDVGIEILPMKSLQQHMSSGPGYYEGEIYNVIRNGRGVPSVPLVVIGIAP